MEGRGLAVGGSVVLLVALLVASAVEQSGQAVMKLADQLLASIIGSWPH